MLQWVSKFQMKKIRVLPWPAGSSNFSPMDNFWDYLVHNVLAHRGHFTTTAELERAIYAEWDAVAQDAFAKFIDSMSYRTFGAIS